MENNYENVDDNKKDKLKFDINTNKAANYLFDISKTIVFVFAIICVFFTFVIRDANITGTSMLDTLHDSDKVILTDFMYTPQSGDIVAINAENQIEKKIIKRVIATEGQTLHIDYNTGKIEVDGVVLDENYVSSNTKKPKREWTVPYVIPNGYVFVMGDNRYVSLDSRDSEIGLIPLGNVIGKAQFIIFPFDRVKYLY